MSAYLEEKLDEIVTKYDFLTAHRGMGLMQGIVCENRLKDCSKSVRRGIDYYYGRNGRDSFSATAYHREETCR